MRKMVVVVVAAVLLLPACNSGSDDTTAAVPESTVTTAAPTSTSEAPPPTATTTTTAGTTTTTMATAAGTMDDPVPAGTWASVGAVDVVVLANEVDATELVLAENEFNTAPEPGNRFVLWRVAVANGGEQATPLLAKVSFAVAGPSTVVYNTSANCGVIPDQLDEFRDVFPGGTVDGNLCWEVADEDAENLVLLVDEFAFSSDRMIFASADTNVPLRVDYPAPVQPEASGPVGTRGNPYPIGKTITVGEWDITVTEATADATAEVIAENSFNEAPTEGRQLFMVGIEATYNGESSDFLFASTSFSTVGPLAVAYTGEDTCGVVPDEIEVFAEVFPGGTVAGNLCWSVRSDDAGGLVLYAQEAVTLDGEPAFFDLR
jgi:hypothetical protein